MAASSLARTAAPVRPRTDSVTWLIVYVVLLYAIPSRLVIEQLGSAGAPSLLVGLLLFAGWAVFQLGQISRDIGMLSRRPVRIALVIFLLCVGVSYLVAMTRPMDADEVSPSDVALLSVLSWSGALLVANDGIQSESRLRTMTRWLTWAGCAMALLGLLQFITGTPIIDRIEIPGLRSAEFDVFRRDGFIRPSGTATHPIEFGVILTMLLPIALHNAQYDSRAPLLARWFPPLAIAVAIALTFSRSAYLSVAVASMVMLIGWPNKTRKIFLGAAAVLAAALFTAVPRLFGTIAAMFRNVDNDPSIASRTDSYDLFWEFFVNWPLFGRGLGTFLPKYRIFDNQYLMLLVGIGVIGTLAFVALLLVGMYLGGRVSARSLTSAGSDAGLSLCAAIAAGAVSLATFDAFAFPMTMGTLFLVLGMAGAAHRLTFAHELPRLSELPT